MVNLLHIATVLSAVVGASYGQTTVNGKPAVPGSLVFEENFNKLDHSIWQHERTMSGGGNWEFQVYENTRENSFCQNGILNIVPTYTDDRYGVDFVRTGTLDLEGGAPADECTNPSFYGCSRSGAPNVINPIMSARIRTVNTFSFKYGRVEVRAKMPTGDWLWPAVWLMPRYNQYGSWPTSGEIDLVESRGNNKLTLNSVNIGNEQVASTMHWGPAWNINGYQKTTWSRNSVPGYNTDFHLYGLEWTENYMKFSVDGVELGTITPPAGGFWELGGFSSQTTLKNPWRFGTKMAPFDEEFYLMINLAVGGTNGYFPDTAVNGGAAKPWSSSSGSASTDFWNARASWQSTWTDSALQVDYVRVWAL